MRVLFVCLGNICRSPTAEGIFRQRLQRAGLAERVEVDSAGTGDWHVGKAPDARTLRVAARRGYDLSGLRARQVMAADFACFDLILAMDHDNLAHLGCLCPPEQAGRVDLFLRRYALDVDEVPDPYHGGEEGFERVLDLLERGCDALLADVERRL